MNQEKIFELLDAIHQTSPGLRAYLAVAMREVQLLKNELLPDDHHQSYPLSILTTGKLKTVLSGKLNPGQHHIRLYFPISILTPFDENDDENYDLQTKATESSSLAVIPERHMQSLYQYFPEFHLLISKIYIKTSSTLLHHIFDLQHDDLSARLLRLLLSEPDIFQHASINDIAGFLGTHPSTLSALRNRKKPDKL